MKYRLLELLQSVSGRNASPIRTVMVDTAKILELANEDRSGRCRKFCGFKKCSIDEEPICASDCAGCYGHEIEEGELVAENGERYAIKSGIPRLLSDSTSEFLRKNKRSFSLEWKYSRNDERNWGQDIELRKQLFLKGMGADAHELRGKLILDAGCGSGLLARAMADSYGMEVVGVDLASGIENAHAKNQNPRLHFVQGSILELPFQSGLFDYVYCAGVLIHLPDTREAFDLLPRLLKPGGRLFIWVYHPISYHERAGDRARETIYQWIRTNVTSRLPIKLQEMFYLCLVVPFAMRQALLRLLNRANDNRSWREKMQNFIDTFSPMYVNRHTEEEVLSWYHSHGFVNCAVAYRERYGFAVRGDLGRPDEREHSESPSIATSTLVNA